MIPALSLAHFTGEINQAMSQANKAMWMEPRILALLALSCGIGLGISYFGLAAQKVVSATSIMVIQNIVKIFVIISGIVYFHDPINSPVMVLGIALSLSGSLYYSKVQADINMRKTKAAKEEQSLTAQDGGKPEPCAQDR